VTAVLPEIEEPATSKEPAKPLGHYVWRRGDTVAICGAALYGIPAFGEFEVCPDCFELRRDQTSGWNGDF
jgi:hypothetical protein